MQQAAFARQPGAEGQYRAFVREAQHLSPAAQARLLSQPDVTVPVVMHIIYDDARSNISDAQVLDALRVINEDFSKTNADTADVLASFLPIFANVGFRFRLAKLDPNGNCTTGITRTYSTDTNVGDDRVKSLIRWDQDRYLNIWICTNANGAGGYAYLPCTGGAGDGIIIRNAQFGTIGTSGGSNFAARSLTHEIGHYFGLPHTWGGSNTPGLPGNCGMDDGIADTPNTTGVQSGCNAPYGTRVGGTVLTDFNPCGVLANVQNYMDYSSCSRMFTLGQKAVMRAALQLSCRQSLTTPANLLATGTNDGYVGGVCAPVVAFQVSERTICEGAAVTFNDLSYNADLTAPGTTYAWQFPGGTPATSSLRQPTVTYPTGGTYDVTLTITNAGGSGTRTETNIVQVQGGNSGLTGPVVESFENPDFPTNFPASDLRNWTTSSSSTSPLATWRRLPAIPGPGGIAVSQGQACLTPRSPNLPAGTRLWLTSPNINLSAFAPTQRLVFAFDRAYAIRPGGFDVLSVQFSTDCGANWVTQDNFVSAQLNTRDTLRTYGYFPEFRSEWATLEVPISPAYLGASRFQVRLQFVPRNGNPIYLDYLRIAVPTTLAATRPAAAARYDLQLFPQPRTAATTVHLTLPAAATVQVSLTDMLGREVRAGVPAALPAGPQILPLPAGALAPGLYLVRVQAGTELLTTKLLVD